MSKKTTSEQSTVLSRRRFMTGAGAGVVAAGAALVATKNPQVAEVTAEVDQGKSKKGYQMSEHVKTYYRTLLV